MNDLRKGQPLKGRNDGVEFAQHDRIIAALGKDADPEPSLVSQRVGSVAGTAPEQIADMPEVIAHQIEGDHLGLKRGELLDGRLIGDWFQVAEGFDLQWLIDGEKQVRDFRLGVQHRG